MLDDRDYGPKLSSDLVLAGLPLWTAEDDERDLIPRRGMIPEIKVARAEALATIAQDAMAPVKLRGLRLVRQPDGDAPAGLRPDWQAAICQLARARTFGSPDATLLAIADAL